MMTFLEFFGHHARVILPAGIVLALFLPGLLLPEGGGELRPLVPFVIGLIYAVAFMRIDLPPMMRALFKPQQIARNSAMAVLILVAIPVLMIGFCQMVGVDVLYLPSVVWYAVAPPIASTAWMCGLLGLNMAVAMEIVVITSLLSPFTGPILAGLFLGQAVPVSSFEMLADLAMMIFGGIVAAQFWQALVGKAWIARHDTALSGLSALGMLVFLIPVFDGVFGRIMAMPDMAVDVLVLAVLLNFSTQAAFLVLARMHKNKADTHAVLAVVCGNRNVGLYYGALPPDPVFGLFTALYQVPLYLTPLFVGLWRRGAG